MVRLYIVRHGETEWNIQKRFQGWKDSHLTEKGRNNALALGRYLSNIEFNKVYCSPSIRTRETAGFVCKDRNLDIVFDENLREINLGVWEGMTYMDVQEKEPDEYHKFSKVPSLFSAKDGETFYQVRERALKVLTRVITENKEGNILIVSHTVLIKSLMTYFKSMSIDMLWEPPYVYDTSFTIVELDGDKVSILSESDRAHLAG